MTDSSSFFDLMLTVVSEGNDDELVTKKDLDILMSMIDMNDEGRNWKNLMERFTPYLSYQVWRHEPETGPTVYRSKTVFEDATPELVRDFFGMMNSDLNGIRTLLTSNYWKSYLILGYQLSTGLRSYHFSALTGVPYSSLRKREKPRRVDLYFSSWLIRPVESQRGDGQFTACEVSLVHYEDMGIPKDVAKSGIRHGMWGTVKKLHSGVRAYQNMRESVASPSKCAQLANITTNNWLDKIDPASGDEDKSKRNSSDDKHWKGDVGIDWKWVVAGGTVAIVCALHTNVVGKALLLGAAQRLARR